MDCPVPVELTIPKIGLLLGLSFFLGLSFEGFYLKSHSSRPGGIRTFPLLAIAGGLLYAIEPHYLVPFTCGLLVLGIWLYPYYRAQVDYQESADEESVDGIMVPLCNLVVYVLGPVTLTQPTWASIGLTVLAVLLLRARERLHALARKVPGEEIITLVQFLILAGIILPLAPREPVTTITTLTPFQVWLAVVVVCSISYASYLVQRYVSPTGSIFFASVLGGLYSSTATTVVLARRVKQPTRGMNQLQSGIVLSTAVMYVRIGLVVAIFNVPLALALAPRLALLAAVGGGIALVILKWHGAPIADEQSEPIKPPNPLEIPAAIIFAILFIVVSLLTEWIKTHFGSVGVYGLAAIVGVTDIDPFVLSLAHGGMEDISRSTMIAAILIAASSNNLLKAIYTVSFGSWPTGRRSFFGLTLLAIVGVVVALLV